MNGRISYISLYKNRSCIFFISWVIKQQKCFIRQFWKTPNFGRAVCTLDGALKINFVLGFIWPLEVLFELRAGNIKVAFWLQCVAGNISNFSFQSSPSFTCMCMGMFFLRRRMLLKLNGWQVLKERLWWEVLWNVQFIAIRCCMK